MRSYLFDMASRDCLHPADSFCYVCGQFIKTRAKKYSVEASRIMCEAYKAYFSVPVGDQDKSWAPHFTGEYCKKTLEGWYRGEKRAMKFAIPRIWREPTDHSSNCYFCMVNPKNRCTSKNAPQIVYQDIPSSIAPVPHSPDLPVPTPPRRHRPSSGDSSKSDSEADTGDMDYDSADEVGDRKPYFPNQKDVNDLIRDLGLTKSNAELLISRLKQWNLVDDSVQVTDPRKRHQRFSNFFSQHDGLCFCNDVAGLFQAIGIACNPIEWRLFIDSSSRSSFVAVVQGFLGNHKAENYVELVQTLIKNYATMGCRMSLKVHILDLHLDKFKENMGAYSEEQGECFHQDILNFERRYQGCIMKT